LAGDIVALKIVFTQTPPSANTNNTHAQAFCNNKDFVWVFLMSSKSEAVDALHMFNENIGAPTIVITDGAGELSKRNSAFYHHARRENIILKTTEPYTPRQSYAETWIGWLKK
jgi:hypothetical protein